MKKKIVFLASIIMCFLFISNGKSQTQDSVKYLSIAGRIQDKETGEPMGGVKITNQTRNNIVASKNNGFYSVVAAPGDIIRFSYVGYEPEYMKINETNSTKATVMVHMKQDSYYIEDVIVSLPAVDELNDYFMSLEVDEDMSRTLAEENPETFKILDNIEEPPPGGPVSFLKKHIFDKIKRKSKKPSRKGKLPKYKD